MKSDGVAVNRPFGPAPCETRSMPELLIYDADFTVTFSSGESRTFARADGYYEAELWGDGCLFVQGGPGGPGPVGPGGRREATRGWKNFIFSPRYWQSIEASGSFNRERFLITSD